MANVCGRSRMTFSTSWQTLPNTGSATLEFKCNGTVSLNGTRCSATQDPVQLRINGTEVVLYPGCTGSRSTNCMTSITPSGSTYKEYSDTGGSLLLCDAMGYSIFNSVADANPGTLGREIGVVQTGPVVYGTASGLKNYGTYVECAP